MRKIVGPAMITALVAACAQPVPDSGAGVGFRDYAQYELERAQREAALTGNGSTTFGAPAPVSTGPLSAIPPAATPPANGGIASSELAQAGIGVQAPVTSGPLNATAPQPAAAPTAADLNLANNPGISDEQNFDAVSGRETIESDAERRAAQAAELIVVDPVPLPAQRADTGVNIVQYALNAPNVRGQEWYSRSILSGDTRFQRNCATYNNPDAAQRDFLSRGGPDRDPRGIDPDGDGFACGWDPAPFKLAAGN
ncbi:hypothetical protein [Yoonia sp. 208BN28-4]|uniref:hypothetical protein n=1 Tax=Yoonia sp. 208BN28-4 TaxID=3126505 RepID=UPI004040326B